MLKSFRRLCLFRPVTSALMQSDAAQWYRTVSSALHTRSVDQLLPDHSAPDATSKGTKTWLQQNPSVHN